MVCRKTVNQHRYLANDKEASAVRAWYRYVDYRARLTHLMSPSFTMDEFSECHACDLSDCRVKRRQSLGSRRERVFVRPCLRVSIKSIRTSGHDCLTETRFRLFTHAVVLSSCFAGLLATPTGHLLHAPLRPRCARPPPLEGRLYMLLKTTTNLKNTKKTAP